MCYIFINLGYIAYTKKGKKVVEGVVLNHPYYLEYQRVTDFD
jgi:hypothetical protein